MRNPDRLPEWRKVTPVVVDAVTVRDAERQIQSCESCTPELAEIPFDCVIDSITGCDPESTDYVLAEPALCPACGALLKTGYWRWSDSEANGRTAFILPGTLVALKKG
jgi:hypothetical protein